MSWVLDAIAFFILALQLPIPVFWLIIHPGVKFWRRRSRRWYYGVAVASWLGLWAVLFGGYGWWVEERLPGQPLLAVAGFGFIAADLWLLRQVKHRMGWKVLVGLAELDPQRPESKVVSEGIYARVRHPRYLGAMMSWWGAALLTGATRLAVLVLVFTALALLVTELEERELLTRLGEGYADYRRRVPRLLPRWP